MPNYITPLSASATGFTNWGGTWYTGTPSFAIDQNTVTKWTYNGLGDLYLSLGGSVLIDKIIFKFDGSVSNGNYVEIYVDDKLVAEGIQPASQKTWDIPDTLGQTITYRTLAKPHNEYLQIAKWSEMSEVSIVEAEPPTQVISDPNNRNPSGKLSITGSFSQGKTLAVSNTLVDKDGIPKAGLVGALSYSWYADGVQIDGATSSNLLLKQEHVNKTISVTASYTDLGGTAESVTLVAKSVANVNDAPTGEITITGTAKQNETLSVSNNLADLDGLGVISYQWKAGGKDIVGATSDMLTLAQAQVGQTISVTASYTDGFGKKESVSSVLTSKVANINDLPTGQLTISGTAAEDQTLRAVTSSLADADGLGTFKYQWQSSSDGSTWTSIKGATAATYKLGDSVVGKYVRATVSYTDKLGAAESVLGESTVLVANVNDKPIGVPTISGKFIEGETLTANASKITDADGLGTFSYLWQTSTDKKTWLDASTDATFQLSGTSAKQFVQLVVNFTDGNGTAESVKSVASAAIATKALTLLGTLSDDNLVGMSGNDTLYGNIGSDTLRGGAGNDIFLYRSVNDSLPQSFDYILDFSAGDKIDLKGIDANTAVAGDQAFAFKTEATKNAVWWNSNMLYGDVNGDAIADFAIQVSLVGLSELKATNIIL